jgi:hypothetical protein
MTSVSLQNLAHESAILPELYSRPDLSEIQSFCSFLPQMENIGCPPGYPSLKQPIVESTGCSATL